MALLIAFAFVAGAGTAVSPCVLPVLPVVLSAGATGGRQRPLGIVTGLALSFTFATVALVYLIDALGLPSGLPRTLAIVVLIGFGISLMLPPVSAQIEARISRVTSRFAPRSGGGDGFGSGLLIGASLGFVYAPCAGPILAGVITVSAAQSFTVGRLAVALAYGIGSAVVLYALALGGRRLTSRLSRRSLALQVAMGAIMVSVGFAMLGDLDTRFETAIANDLPSFLVNPTGDLEDNGSVQSQIASVRGRIGDSDVTAHEAGAQQADRGETLPVLGRAPELVGTQHWFNTPDDRPLSLRGLRGKVVLIDFWTYSCINCIRTLPYLNSLVSPLPIEGVRDRRRPYAGVPIRAQRLERRGGDQPGRHPLPGGPGQRLCDLERLRQPVLAGRISDRRPGPRPSRRVRRGQLRGQGEGDPHPAGRAGGRAPRRRVKGQGAGSLAGDRHPGDISRFGARGAVHERADHARQARLPDARSTGENQLAYRGSWRIETDKATALPERPSISPSTPGVYSSFLAPRNSGATCGCCSTAIRSAAGAAGPDVRAASLRVRAQTLYSVVDMPRVERHMLTLSSIPESPAMPSPSVELGQSADGR